MKNCTKLGIWDDARKCFLISLWSRRNKLICSSNSGRNRRCGNWICRIPPLWVVAETWVKSGEEWWRVELTLHLAKRPVYRGLRGMGEEWRVFHGTIVYSFLGIKNPRGGLVPLSLMAGFTMPYGQSTGRYGASWLFLVRQWTVPVTPVNCSTWTVN